jgi:hypothetical protein
LNRFDLQPGLGSLRSVRSVGSLGNNPLVVQLRGPFKDGLGGNTEGSGTIRRQYLAFGCSSSNPSGLAHHLVWQLFSPSIRISQLRDEGQQSQQLHRGHHYKRRGMAQQSSCRAQLCCNQNHWWEVDLTYAALRIFVLLGVAWDVQLPKRFSGVSTRQP